MGNGKVLSADSWEEMYNLIMENMPKNCISCKFGNDGKTEDAKRFVFCTHMEVISMVDLTLMQGCARFKDEKEDN